MEFDNAYALEEYCTLDNYPVDVRRLKDLWEMWNDAGDDRENQEEVIAEALTELPISVSHMVAREWKTDVADDERRSIARAVLLELVRKPQGFFDENAGYVRYGEYLRSGHILPDDFHRTALDRLRKATVERGEPREITISLNDEMVVRDEWLVPAWLPAGRVAILTGRDGWGESKLALQLGAAVAAGDPTWLQGGPVTTQPECPIAQAATGQSQPPLVVFATWEEGPDDIARNLRRIGDNANKVGDRLHVLDFAGKGPLWRAPERSEGIDPKLPVDKDADELGSAGRPDKGPHYKSTLTAVGGWLRTYCRHYSAALLVIDPLEAAFAYGGTDCTLVRDFIASWDLWARDQNCTVLFVSHVSISKAANPRSAEWRVASRTMWTFGLEPVREPKTGEVEVTSDQPETAPRLACIKSSAGALPEPLWLEMDESGPWRVSRTT